MKQLTYMHYDSPIGTLLLASDNQALRLLVFQRPDQTPEQQIACYFSEEVTATPSLTDYRDWTALLDRYFRGETVDWSSLPYRATGTPFRERVWEALEQIPYGETCSYTDIAEAIGRPTATRAVATSCGANPIGIIIPCHRVIHKDGTMSGYAGGVDKKEALLSLEQNVKAASLPSAA